MPKHREWHIAADNILKQLEDKCIQRYFFFLKYSLNYMNTFNALFQSKNVLIQDLHSNSVKLFLEVCQNFIKGDTLSVCYDKFPNLIHAHNYLPIEKVYTGPECESLLISLPTNIQHDVRVHILDFYVTLSKEIIQRLPLTSDIFQEMAFLKPQNAFNKNRHVLVELPQLTEKYKNFFDASAIALEWRSLPYAFDNNEVQQLENMPIDTMWLKIKKFKDFNDVEKFKTLGILASIVLTLPHSNADAERIFSVINDVKTRKRNRIGDDTLNAICTVRSSFSSNNTNCTNFQVTESHLNLCNSDIYK
jgi:hypothetical protein